MKLEIIFCMKKRKIGTAHGPKSMFERKMQLPPARDVILKKRKMLRAHYGWKIGKAILAVVQTASP